MGKKKDLTSAIQRLEAFEERLNVRFEALSAFETKEEYSDDADIRVRGEMHSTSGTELDTDIDIVLSVYDAEGRVVETSTEYVEQDSFFGFHTFELACDLPPKVAAKLRLIPKKS